MIWFWIGFTALIVLFLALDLGVFHRNAHVVSIKEALSWSGVWIATSLLFSVFIYFAYDNHWLGIGLPSGENPRPQLDGSKAITLYLTGYVVEWALSVDNIFVIALIFGYFKIPAIYQHRVLFWGIIGAIVMRGIFIAVGTVVIEQLNWIIYVFGAFLIFTAYKMLTAEGDPDPSKSTVIRLVHKYLPVTDEFDGQKFIKRNVILNGGPKAWALTPLAVALIVVEATDVIFAVDSIPAIFGITTDPLLIFTSNIFAVLGLRSMYFALAGLLDKFHLLKVALALILGLVGVKMLSHHFLEKIPFFEKNLSFVTLAMILLLLAGGVILSLVFPKPHKPNELNEVT